MWHGWYKSLLWLKSQSSRSMLGQDPSGYTSSCKQDVCGAIPGTVTTWQGTARGIQLKYFGFPNQSRCMQTANGEGYPACDITVFDGGSRRDCEDCLELRVNPTWCLKLLLCTDSFTSLDIELDSDRQDGQETHLWMKDLETSGLQAV